VSTDQLVGVEVIVERQSVDVGGVLAAEIMNMRLNTGGCGIVMLWRPVMVNGAPRFSSTLAFGTDL